MVWRRLDLEESFPPVLLSQRRATLINNTLAGSSIRFLQMSLPPPPNPKPLLRPLPPFDRLEYRSLYK